MPELLLAMLSGAAVLLAGAGARERRMELLAGHVTWGSGFRPGPHSRRAFPGRSVTRSRHLATALGAGIGAIVGLRLAGPVGLGMGALMGAAGPVAYRRRAAARRADAMERQLAELVESASLAVRSGLSLPRALEFAAGEVGPPLGPVIAKVRAEQDLGSPIEPALEHFGDALGTDDARLFVLVVGVHLRSGGNLAGALDEVATTIRHRLLVRRELRTLSAQGRISGAVLGVLPVAFFFVLAATSHRELAPVYRSPAGLGMVGAGLLMQALAYVWIRRLMKVDL